MILPKAVSRHVFPHSVVGHGLETPGQGVLYVAEFLLGVDLVGVELRQGCVRFRPVA